MNDKPDLMQPAVSPADWIERALAIDDIDDAEYYDLVWALQKAADGAGLDTMMRLSRGDLPARRLALVVLGRFGEPERVYEAEISARLLQMWRENAGDTASDLVGALSHYCEFADVREVLLGLVEHPDFWARWYLTHAFAHDSEPESLAALIRLSRDPDELVRDMATFLLGNGSHVYDADIRAALMARLDDADATTRIEAIHGLLEQGETAVLDDVLRALQPDEKGETLFDQTEITPHDDVLPALEAMRDNAELNDADADKVRMATATCQNPGAC